MKRGKDQDFFVCPSCGASVRVGAVACPECGSDAETGWSEDADKWSADIPSGYGSEEDFDYDEFIAQEFPRDAPVSYKRTLKRWSWGVGIFLLCIALLLYLLTY